MKELIKTLRDSGVGLELSDNDIEVSFYKGDVEDSVVELIRSNKEELKEYLRSISLEENYSEIPQIEKSQSYQISDGQHRLWVLSQFEETSAAYNMSSRIVLDGSYEITYFEQAINAVIQRHEILRTTFSENENQELRQWIQPAEAIGFKIDYEDYRQKRNPERCAESYILEDEPKLFDLEKGPLLRAALLQIDNNKYIFYYNLHHIICDGWSKEILARDVLTYYTALKESKLPEIKDLRIQYKDYSAWQRNALSSKDNQLHRDYWLKHLSGELPLLDLPTSKIRPKIQTNNGHRLAAYLPKSVSKDLKKFNKSNGGSLFMGLLASWHVLLYRYSSQKEIVIGTTVAGRDHLELEDQIGFYVNTLALLNKATAEDSFATFYERVKETTLASFSHQQYSFDRLVNDLNIQRDTSRSPVFDVVLTLLNGGAGHKVIDIPKGVIDEGPCLAKFDLVIDFEEAGDSLYYMVEFNTDVYEQAMIEQLMIHFQQLLQQLLANPNAKISTIEYLTEEEQNLLIYGFNDYKVSYPHDQTIIDAFENQVKLVPDNIAVTSEDRQLTYLELDEISNALAYFINQELSPAKGELITVMIERDEWILVSMIAIFKLGCTYVPIDPSNPQERINYFLNDSASRIILNEEFLTSFKKKRATLPTSFENVAISNSDIAYVIYTSGSTGQPKGAMVEHEGMLHHLYAMEKEFSLDQASIIAQTAVCTSDISVWQLLNGLIVGGKTVIYNDALILDIEQFLKRAELDQVTILQVVPSYLQLILDIESSLETNRLSQLSFLSVAGEPVSKQLLDRWFDSYPNVKVINAYGPAEASDDVTFHHMESSPEGNNVPIGKPMMNTYIHILNDDQVLQPIGVIGEITVSGICVGRGYLNRKELTDKKFLANPFIEGERLYKTGDLGRWLPDGTLEFLGRLDDQVKIRGFRVELGEIEASISSHPGVKGAKVLIEQSETGIEQELKAYAEVNELNLPLLYNSINLFQRKQIESSDLYELPNGLPVFGPNKNELDYLYEEIFADAVYLKHGITLKADSCVFDVGANVGLFSIFANLWSEDITVYSFEPIPEVFNHLAANCEMYGVKGKTFNLAMMEKEGETSFVYYPSMTMLSSISDDKAGAKEIVRSFIENSEKSLLNTSEIDPLLDMKLESKHLNCKTKSLSQVIAEEHIEKIDLLKIDTENSEHLVLEGLTEGDWDKIDQMIIEIHDENGRLEEIKNLLIDKGFQVFVEKEELLSKNDLLFNLYALRQESDSKKMDSHIIDKRSAQWMSPNRLKEGIIKELIRNLPSYMVPSSISLIDRFPVTANGKIDKKALMTHSDLQTEKSHIEPQTELEKRISSIWSYILEKDKISLLDDFFVLGGHSLKAIRLLNEYYKEFDIKLQIKDLFINTSVKSHVGLLNSSASVNYEKIPEIESTKNYAVSDGQRRLWILSQFGQGSAAYNIPSNIKLDGSYDIPIFKRSVEAVVERHEILRTVFKEDENGDLRQWVLPSSSLNFEIDYKDFRGASNPESIAESYISEDSYRPFDLEKGPLIRACLMQMSDTSCVFYFNMHHIISDGWSEGILNRDLISFYQALKEGRKPNLPSLTIQYKDYSSWQQSQLETPSFQLHRDYWLDKLSGDLSLIDLPSAILRPKIKTYQGRQLSSSISESLTGQLKEFSQSHGGSLFMGLLAAWNVLIHRYTSQTDIIVGSPVAGRDHPDLENQIGFYVNTLVMRNHLDPKDDFNRTFLKVKDTTLSSYSHQMYPFDRLVEDLDLPRDASRSPIFDMILAYQNQSDNQGHNVKTENIVEGIVDAGSCRPKFDLDIYFEEFGDSLHFIVQYNVDVYDRAMVERLMNHYKQLLSQLLLNPKTCIGDVSYLSDEEGHKLLNEFNQSESVYPKDKSIIELFSEQVKRQADQTAVVFDQTEISYQKLDEISDLLAFYLLSKYKIEPEDLIGIKVDRSEVMIISILGVLKSGGAYVPIDPDNPKERIEFIQKDSSCKLCIDEHEFSLFEQWKDSVSKKPKLPVSSPTSLAYAIYTSGSTGRPKGVLVEQRSVVRLVKATNYVSIEPGDRILGLSNFSFDGSIFDIFMPLLNGGTLVISDKNVFLDIEKLNDIIKDQRVSSFFLTTALFNTLVEARLDALASLKYLLFGGEQVSVRHVKQFRESYPLVNLHHVYGPTENTTFSTFYKIDKNYQESRTIPVGSPIANSTSYILDAQGRLAPIGVFGEICLGGDGLSRGYLNRPELTAEKFIAHPFKQGDTLYRSGDIGRWLPDGNIEFLGREDDQVKIRGYRVELREIESQLLNHHEILEAIVLAKQSEGTNDKELVAYFVPKNEVNALELKEYLTELLPSYMIPDYYMPLNKFPMKRTGKIDKQSLPAYSKADIHLSTEYVAPQSEIEKQLIGIIAEQLNQDESLIGVKNNFFEMGVNSIKIVKVLHAMNANLNLKLTVTDLFEHPNVHELTQHLMMESQNENAKGEETNLSDELDEIMDLI